MQYSIESIPISNNDLVIFVALKEHDNLYELGRYIKNTFPKLIFELVLLDDETRGQSETVLASREFVNDTDELLIYNIDTYFKSKTLLKNLRRHKKMCDGIIGSFLNVSSENHWSFAKINENNFVLEVREKEKISDHALTGLYHFSKAKYFFTTAERHIKNNILTKGEFYIAPLYNDLISQGKNFILDIVDDFVPLGTPSEVENFDKS